MQPEFFAVTRWTRYSSLLDLRLETVSNESHPETQSPEQPPGTRLHHWSPNSTHKIGVLHHFRGLYGVDCWILNAVFEYLSAWRKIWFDRNRYCVWIIRWGIHIPHTGKLSGVSNSIRLLPDRACTFDGVWACCPNVIEHTRRGSSYIACRIRSCPENSFQYGWARNGCVDDQSTTCA